MYSRYLTAFNRQIAEGVALSCAAETINIVLNSKGEQIGESLKRKVVSRNSKEVTLLIGDQSRYTTK